MYIPKLFSFTAISDENSCHRKEANTQAFVLSLEPQNVSPRVTSISPQQLAKVSSAVTSAIFFETELQILGTYVVPRSSPAQFPHL
jgi:hypothetical protein